MKRGKVNIVMGAQAGSEAKGKMGAYLAAKFGVKTFAGNLSPNAGHTVWVGGKKVVTHHIPASVMGMCMGGGNLEEAHVILGPATVINPTVFDAEIRMLEREWGMEPRNVVVDERAAIIKEEYVRKEEEGLTHIGSTAQGVGVARAEKVMRRGKRAVEEMEMRCKVIGETDREIRRKLEEGETVIYEASQGFDLCLEHGVDPMYCTSRTISPQACMADAGVPFKWMGDVYAVVRTYPIRVNNRKGSSGPYPSKEITWETIRARCGAPADLTEITTTTKLPRRVFEFAWGQIRRMVEVCDPTWMCVQFGNYLNWKLYGGDRVKTGELVEFCIRLEETTGKRVAYVGTSERNEGMIDRGYDKWEK